MPSLRPQTLQNRRENAGRRRGRMDGESENVPREELFRRPGDELRARRREKLRREQEAHRANSAKGRKRARKALLLRIACLAITAATVVAGLAAGAPGT